MERALGVAQRAEEAKRQLQVQMEERVAEVEKASEEERKSLQQELTRVKQEVVNIMKVRGNMHMRTRTVDFQTQSGLWWCS